jgi:hypothetical protein
MVFPAVYWAVFVILLFYFTPYFFMNPTQIGWGAAVLWFAGFLAAFAGIAFGLVWMDSSEKASRIFGKIFAALLGLAGFATIGAVVSFGGLLALLWLLSPSARISSSQEFFALENSTDIPAEGISIEAGISLYVNLRGNWISFQTHDRDDILVTYRLCSHSIHHQPVYTFDGAWLRIADEIRTTGRRQFKNSTYPGGEITVFVPANMEHVFYVAEITNYFGEDGHSSEAGKNRAGKFSSP